MKFRNYCIVVMGDTGKVIKEIEDISEIKPNILDAGGLLLCTFTSTATVKELTQLFIDNNRNFLIFDLDEKSSGVNIIKKTIHDGLFGFLKTVNIEDKTKKLIREIESTSDGYGKTNKKTPKRITVKPIVKRINEDDIMNMTKNEKKQMMDMMIDNGVEKLTEHDKKILQLLAK